MLSQAVNPVNSRTIGEEQNMQFQEKLLGHFFHNLDFFLKIKPTSNWNNKI